MEEKWQWWYRSNLVRATVVVLKIKYVEQLGLSLSGLTLVPACCSWQPQFHLTTQASQVERLAPGNSDSQRDVKLAGKEGTGRPLQRKHGKGSHKEITDPIIVTQILCYTCLLITWSSNELWKNTRCKLHYIIRVTFSSCGRLWMASIFINKPFNQNT